MKWLRIALYGLFLAICLTAGVAGRVTSNVLTSFKGKSTVEVWQGLTNPRALFPNQNRLTILLVGQDYNRDRKGMAYTKNSRSDTIMLLAVDLDKRQMRAVSIPRDTFVEAPDGRSGKINGTFARGGIELLRDTLTGLFSVQIDHHVIIKPDAVRNIVDAVGGVTVETIDEMKYDDNWGGLHVDLPKGRQRIDGRQAEGFVRFREVNRTRMNAYGRIVPIRGVKASAEEGDLRRAARQQQLIHALVAEANNTANLVALPEIIDTGFEQISTTLTRTQCLALATLFRGAGQSAMKTGTVPGTDDTRGGAYYYVLDRDRAQATVDWLIKGDEFAMRRLVRVEVRNGSGTPGVARAAAELIEQTGYNASAPGNAQATEVTTIVYRRASYEEAAREIQKRLGAPAVEKAPAPGNDWEPEIEVVIGKDLAESVRRAT